MNIEWANHTLENTTEFGLQGVDDEARVVSVHDGDTLKVLLPIPWAGGVIRRVTLRLLGVDAPEIRTLDLAEKGLANRARDRVLSWLAPDLFGSRRGHPLTDAEVEAVLHTNVVLARVQCAGADKYGRCLATVRRNGHGCINDILLEEGYASEYDGGISARRPGPARPPPTH